jgi:small basic protein (TIGR04137 family)
MSLHRSLRTKPTALNQHRNVLTRAERIERLKNQERFKDEENSPLGLVKVANRQMVTAKKEKAPKAEGDAAATPGTAPAAGAAPAAAAAPAAKGAKPGKDKK